MSDEQPQAGTTSAPDAPTVTAPAQDASANTQPETTTADKAPKSEMTLEDALRELREARAEAAKYRTSAKAKEREMAKAEEEALREQGKYKELYEKMQADLAKAQEDISRRERVELQRRVADKVGLPAKLAVRISGQTEEEMEADAAEMRSALPAAIVGNDGKQGANGKPQQQPIGGMTREQLAQFLNVDSKFIPER